MRIVLASKSPRRKELLEGLGVKFDILVANCDESSDEKCPERLVEALARKKGEAVRALLDDDCLVIACDTLVFASGEVLGKPKSKEDAERMIRLLSGKSHSVISGLYLSLGEKSFACHEVTKVNFNALTDREIEDYISQKEPYDKAGAYGIQGRASVFINSIEGDYFNVVGLPLSLLYRSLKEEFGIDILNI